MARGKRRSKGSGHRYKRDRRGRFARVTVMSSPGGKRGSVGARTVVVTRTNRRGAAAMQRRHAKGGPAVGGRRMNNRLRAGKQVGMPVGTRGKYRYSVAPKLTPASAAKHLAFPAAQTVKVAVIARQVRKGSVNTRLLNSHYLIRQPVI